MSGPCTAGVGTQKVAIQELKITPQTKSTVPLVSRLKISHCL